ncbi:hypothetical protein P6144_20040 [Sphingomonas sp. HITSZ_GF]|uniref:hypothetical protein n=1 Tax=Sphingomonas sp. HITSZ_GF TaxID=3037247 RepID=UPI00240D694D|nr:hypothetical protein [Sphingomonas sp. HITSZ_GF]MDG2535961.1 hypothetical protein [Sphingomonas sp. HITSZ_GF]
MTRKTLVSAAATLLAGITFAAGAVSPAAAVGNDPAAKPKQEEQSPKADSRKYCIDALMTGSRIPKRQCRTRADWLADGIDPLELMKQPR